jgi:hypothetical protein
MVGNLTALPGAAGTPGSASAPGAANATIPAGTYLITKYANGTTIYNPIANANNGTLASVPAAPGQNPQVSASSLPQSGQQSGQPAPGTPTSMIASGATQNDYRPPAAAGVLL